MKKKKRFFFCPPPSSRFFWEESKNKKKRGGGMGDFFKGPPLSQKERQASFSLSMISLFFCVCPSFSFFFLSSSFFF